MIKEDAMCTWGIKTFPRTLRDRYKAWVIANGVTIQDHLQYLILKTLRDAGVDIPKMQFDELVERLKKGKVK